jgi:hypothetical protein
LGVAGGQVAELFEPIEVALDDVALLVEFSVEGGWASATAAARCAAGGLVVSFRADEANLAIAQRLPG